MTEENVKLLILTGAGVAVGVAVLYGVSKAKAGVTDALAALRAPFDSVGDWASGLPARFAAYKAADIEASTTTRAEAVREWGDITRTFEQSGVYVPEGFNLGGHPSDLPIAA